MRSRLEVTTLGLDRESYVGETDSYRRQRDQLLLEELALSDQTERVAELRRRLGTNPVVADYVLQEIPAPLDMAAAPRAVRLAELFQDGQRTLILQHVMFAPDEDEACPMCSMWADAFNAIAHHVRRQASVVLTAKAGIEKFRAWGRGRGWTNIRLLSSFGSSFQRDFGFEDAEGEQTPGLSVFSLTADGRVQHCYSVHAHMMGEHWRGMDPLSPVWNLLDLTPEGRDDWMPGNDYGREVVYGS
jgi:predicted dithiol-disulfide oxidoreductase (DUF899 family)